MTRSDSAYRRLQTPAAHIEGITHAAYELLLTGDYSDLTIRCGSESLPCHRCIITLQSPVLQELISRNIPTEVPDDQEPPVLLLPGEDPATFKRVLAFLYTGEYEYGEEPFSIDKLKSALYPGSYNLKKDCLPSDDDIPSEAYTTISKCISHHSVFKYHS